MTFEEHVEKLGALALTIFPYHDTFKLYETDKNFFMSVKYDRPPKYKNTYPSEPKVEFGGELKFFKEFVDDSCEIFVARGDSLSALEEQLELLKGKR